MRTRISAIAAIFLLGAALAGEARAAEPRLSVTPAIALLDRPIEIRLTGVRPHQLVDFTLERDGATGSWTSAASWKADARGTVDLATCSSQSGTYRGVDAMGLFWSLKPPAPGGTSPSRPRRSEYTYVLRASAGGKTIARTQFVRTSHSTAVKEIPLPDFLIGKAFAPIAAGSHPAILLVGGSEGGHSMDTWAELLAARGFVTLSLAYFGAPTLPANLVNVPLETVKSGIDWLAARPEVNADRIGMIGASKGGELTLLSASMFPQIKAAVGLVPSSVVWMGISQAQGPEQSSWTYGGKPLPFVPADPQAGMALGAQFAKRRPVSFEPYYSASLQNADAVAKATIPVEKINGPVLVVSGDSDAMWPSSRMSDLIMQRLRSMHHPYPDQHLHYKGAGHTAFFPYLPAYGNTAVKMPWGELNLGGTDAGDAAAAEIAWPKIVEFFNAALHNEHAATLHRFRKHGSDRAENRGE